MAKLIFTAGRASASFLRPLLGGLKVETLVPTRVDNFAPQVKVVLS